MRHKIHQNQRLGKMSHHPFFEKKYCANGWKYHERAYPWQEAILNDNNGDVIFQTPLDQTDNLGSTPLHYFCTVATTEQLKLALERIPKEQWELTDQSGLHCFNYIHNQDVVRFILSNDLPEAFKPLRLAKSNDGNNFFHFLAFSGNLEAIQFALSDKLPDEFKPLRLAKNNHGNNFFHFLAESGNLEAIQWALSDKLPEEFKQLLLAKSNNGSNFFHFLAESGNLEAIQWALSDNIPEEFKPLLSVKINDGRNFFHLLARSGNLEAIQLALSDKLPEEFKPLRLAKNNDSRNFFHFLAGSGNLEAIQWALSDKLPEEFKPLHLAKDNNGDHFFHFLAFSNNEHSIRFFIKNHPELAASMWIPDKNGDTVDSLANKITIKPTQILKVEIGEALMSIPNLSALDIRLLKAFKAKTLEFLQNPDFISDEIARKILGSKYIEDIFGKSIDHDLKIIFKLQAIKNKNQLTKNLLIEIIAILGNSPAFPIKYLLRICQQISENNFPENIQHAAQLLSLWLQDQKQINKLSDNNKTIFSVLKSTLLKTAELAALMPKGKEACGIEIQEVDFKNKLDDIEKVIENSNLGEHRETILRVLNGIRSLTTDFDKINQFAKDQAGKLYELDPGTEKLPLHLEHYGTDDKLKKTLNNTVIAYISAFGTCRSKGLTSDFFHQTATGYCLDNRIRELGTWVVENADTPTLDDAMRKYVAEYQSYRELMYRTSDFRKGEDTLESASDFILYYHKDELYKKPIMNSNPIEYTREKINKKIIDSYIKTTLHWISESVFNYREARASRNIFSLFGFSKQVKLSAADKLIDYLKNRETTFTKQELKALTEKHFFRGDSYLRAAVRKSIGDEKLAEIEKLLASSERSITVCL